MSIRRPRAVAERDGRPCHADGARTSNLDRAARRPGDPDHGVLRLRRRRQDDHRRGARAARGRARPGRRSCSPSTRPGGWPSRSGSTELDNTPRPVHGHRPGERRRLHAMMLDMKRTFDEIVLDARDARAGRADPGQPLLPVAVRELRRHAGVHGDGEAGPAARTGRVGPDRGRHAAEPLRAGLPGRARSGSARFLDGTVDPDPAGAGEGRRPRRVQAAHRGVRPGHRGARARCSAAGCCGDVQAFVAALDTMFGGFRERAEQTYRAAPGPGHRVRRGRRAGAGRAARGVVLRASGWPTSACRWPAWCSTGCTRS